MLHRETGENTPTMADPWTMNNESWAPKVVELQNSSFKWSNIYHGNKNRKKYNKLTVNI